MKIFQGLLYWLISLLSVLTGGAMGLWALWRDAPEAHEVCTIDPISTPAIGGLVIGVFMVHKARHWFQRGAELLGT